MQHLPEITVQGLKSSIHLFRDHEVSRKREVGRTNSLEPIPKVTK